MIRAVVFDLGGVLIELSGVPTFNTWVGDHVTPDEIWKRWLTSPAVRAFERGQTGAEEFAEQLIDEFALPVNRQAFLDAFGSWPRGLFPGAADLIRRVDRRCVRATLSNTNALHWPRFLADFEQLFDHHFPSHLTGKLKPDSDVFAHVIDALACQPGEILFLDDQPLNAEAARHAGITATVVRGVHEAEQALAEFGCLAANVSPVGQ
jgi:glucose-1-phosphatase